MDIIEKMDMDNQMTMLQGAAMEDGAQNISDEIEDLSNSLREIVKDMAVKPKLQCLMMDPAFSMVTLQSEDSGILWETASSRCSTPWASEISSPAPDVCNSLVPKCPATPGSETAGRIIFIMDEDHMIRRKKRKRNRASEKPSGSTDEVMAEPDRPAMVEISVPNLTMEKESKMDEREDPKEERNQRLFRLVSEGSEILNIVVPPKVSTVDEEESKGLVDNLSYLEDMPVIKASEIADEPETYGETQSEKLQHLQAFVPTVPEPLSLLPPIKPTQKEATCEDYFEKFTLLDHQAPTGAPTAKATQESENEVENKSKDNATGVQPAPEGLDDSEFVSGLEITSEHVDEVFYGGGRDPDFQNTTNGAHKQGELPKSPLKKSGCALFGSQESILTPIFLPEGPQKIIDLVLLEEPKAMAFMYSDLYADAEGSRKRQDDAESLTSEKSFHSQESDIEDRGYLEKFVLKDETPVTKVDPIPDDCKEDGERMWSRDAFGLTHHDKDVTGTLEGADDITDFFRNSASSSPCESIQLDQVEPEETRQKSKPRRVAFQDKAVHGEKRTTDGGNILQPSEVDIEIAEAFLPLDIGMDPYEVGASLETADYKTVITEYAARTVAAKPIKSEKTKITRPPREAPIKVPQTVKPITPRQKPFLDLTPLLPVETPEEEDGPKAMKSKEGGEKDANAVCSSTAKQEETTGEAQDYELITKQEASECALMPQQGLPTGREGANNGGFTTSNPS